jgi:DNA-binding NtrC family response regulator
MPLTILFVDDEFAVTRLARQILPNYGINVVTENDSHKALAMFSERAADFDLLVTDQIMPGLSDIVLTREVLKIKPELPVILCTGYSEEASPEQAKEMGVAEYVLKPPDFQMMAGMIYRLVTAAKNR